MRRGSTAKATPAMTAAVAATAIAIAVMTITIAVAIGFKRQIRQKVIAFDAHLQIVNYDNNNTYDMHPVCFDSALIDNIKQLPQITHVSHFNTKPGIVKTDDNVHAIIFKGITDDYHWDSFAENITQQEQLPPSQAINDNTANVIISTTVARLMKLNIGDDFLCYFVGDKVRARKFHITALYNTDLQDYDKLFIIGNAKVIQKLNHWEPDQYCGLEVITNDFDNISTTTSILRRNLANRFDKHQNAYFVQNTMMTNQQIFGWLDLLDINVVVIIMLMLIVSIFTLIAALIVIILDAIQHIATLKALGATNRQIQNIFLLQAAAILIRGLLIGNITGIALCAIQYFTHAIPLDPVSYYVNYVPIAFTWTYWLALNIGVIAITLLMLLAPAHIIANVNPARVIRYE
ncbi:MAG TPA: ABC transporter permease [Bacteroidales bacterium]|nr:ABC transporter permease [Bacteroidales bacterium]